MSLVLKMTSKWLLPFALFLKLSLTYQCPFANFNSLFDQLNFSNQIERIFNVWQLSYNLVHKKQRR